MNARLKPDWEFRPMRTADLDRVIEIEQAAYAFPWTRGIFEDCLRVGYSAWIAAEHQGPISAYGLMSIAVGEAHVLNLCVDPAMRRGGLGRELMEHLIAVARRAGVAQMFLEVRPSNPAAVALYAGLAFREIGRRPGYYPAEAGREDAVVLAREL